LPEISKRVSVVKFIFKQLLTKKSLKKNRLLQLAICIFPDTILLLHKTPYKIYDVLDDIQKMPSGVSGIL